jgi:hypothetical protein
MKVKGGLPVTRVQVNEICTLLGYYTVYTGNSLPTFWDNLSFPSSRSKIFLDDITVH